ncbi:MAG: DUF1080 domain-containing protein [Bacteroidia bacterium]|nr:DUF1080 domain-containing protein [Bacteroidia bacterium]
MWLSAQNWDREKQDPVATEVWAPRPPKVTPGTGTAAPSDAIVLFDGTSFNNWEHADGSPVKWKLEDGAMTVVGGTSAIQTKMGFGSVQLHVEWRSPAEVKGEGQGRGNSGIFLMGKYELQVLDSYESQTYANGQAGSIYKQSPPLVNPTKGPGEWQTYDIIFMAPVFGERGQLLIPGSITVLLNGVLVQNHHIIVGPTEYKGFPQYLAHPTRLPLALQDHGNPVSFRNIWVREL